VNIECTRHVLLNTAPNDIVKPIDNVHTRAFKINFKLKIKQKYKHLTAQIKFIADSELLLPSKVESIPIKRTLVYERIQPAIIKLLICGLDIRINLLKEKQININCSKQIKINLIYLCVRKIILKTKNPIARNIPIPLLIPIIVYVNTEIL
jgi:hypothetical protein